MLFNYIPIMEVGESNKKTKYEQKGKGDNSKDTQVKDEKESDGDDEAKDEDPPEDDSPEEDPLEDDKEEDTTDDESEDDPPEDPLEDDGPELPDEVDSPDDTSEEPSDDSSEDETPEDDPDAQKKEQDRLQSYKLISSFEKLYSSVSLNIIKLNTYLNDDIIINKIVVQVKKNLLNLEALLYQYITLKFNKSTYVQNLYTFNYFIEVYKINVGMLKKISEIR
jgi:hypothetical protein